MNIQDQVCSLELAKRLKELGVKQNSYFVWFKLIDKDSFDLAEKWQIDDAERFEEISAFTACELGEMLPCRFKQNQTITIQGLKDNVVCEQEINISHDFHIDTSKVEINNNDYWYCWAIGQAYDNYGIQISELAFCKHDESFANSMAKMLIYLIENKLIESPK
jgi:hypothetical protein